MAADKIEANDRAKRSFLRLEETRRDANVPYMANQLIPINQSFAANPIQPMVRTCNPRMSAPKKLGKKRLRIRQTMDMALNRRLPTLVKLELYNNLSVMYFLQVMNY